MYCEHCGKPLSDYSGICKSCNKITDISSGDPVYDAYRMAQKKKSHDTFICGFFVILAFCILISAIIVHDEPYRQESKVSADMQLADSIHTAILTSIMDPEIQSMKKFPGDYDALTEEFDITQYTGDENCILAGAAEILDMEDLHDLGSRLRSRGATGRILVTILNPTHVQVRLEGTYVSEYGEEIIIR